MKDIYEEPEIIIVDCGSCDIITASETITDNENIGEWDFQVKGKNFDKGFLC